MAAARSLGAAHTRGGARRPWDKASGASDGGSRDPCSAFVLFVVVLVLFLELTMDRKIRHVPIARESDKGLEAVEIDSMRRLVPQILKLYDPSAAPGDG